MDNSGIQDFSNKIRIYMLLTVETIQQNTHLQLGPKWHQCSSVLRAALHIGQAGARK